MTRKTAGQGLQQLLNVAVQRGLFPTTGDVIQAQACLDYLFSENKKEAENGGLQVIDGSDNTKGDQK
jgi:hypothetical protein